VSGSPFARETAVRITIAHDLCWQNKKVEMRVKREKKRRWRRTRLELHR
jgi:hypothetical protein